MEETSTPFTLLTGRELATVLAALRLWQARHSWGECPINIENRFVGHFGEHRPLTPHEIDALCEQLNCPH